MTMANNRTRSHTKRKRPTGILLTQLLSPSVSLSPSFPLPLFPASIPGAPTFHMLSHDQEVLLGRFLPPCVIISPVLSLFVVGSSVNVIDSVHSSVEPYLRSHIYQIVNLGNHDRKLPSNTFSTVITFSDICLFRMRIIQAWSSLSCT